MTLPPFREFRSTAGLPRRARTAACVYWVKIVLVLPSSGCSRLPFGCAGRVIPARLRISERFQPACRGSRPAQPAGTTGRRPSKAALRVGHVREPRWNDGVLDVRVLGHGNLGMSGPVVRSARPAGRRRNGRRTRSAASGSGGPIGRHGPDIRRRLPERPLKAARCTRRPCAASLLSQPALYS